MKSITGKIVLRSFIRLAATGLLIMALPIGVLAFFCPDCGTRNSDEFKFCVKCGKDLMSAKMKISDESSPVSGKAQGNQEIDFLNKSGFSDLLNNPGNNLRAMELMETLRQDPNSMSLFERYKDAGYQSQLLEGLKSVNDESNPEMDANIKSLEGLFRMLNGIGGGSEGSVEDSGCGDSEGGWEFDAK